MFVNRQVEKAAPVLGRGGFFGDRVQGPGLAAVVDQTTVDVQTLVSSVKWRG